MNESPPARLAPKVSSSSLTKQSPQTKPCQQQPRQTYHSFIHSLAHGQRYGQQTCCQSRDEKVEMHRRRAVSTGRRNVRRRVVVTVVVITVIVDRCGRSLIVRASDCQSQIAGRRNDSIVRALHKVCTTKGVASAARVENGSA